MPKFSYKDKYLQKLRQLVKDRLPEGTVVPRHDEKGHHYFVPALNQVLDSVTTKLQVLKDEGLINFKQNRALDYVFTHWKEFTDANVLEHLSNAKRVSTDLFEEAGDIGTQVHNIREKYFSEWIKSGHRPEQGVFAFLPDGKTMESTDGRVISALRALESFCNDTGYQPVACELYVYVYDPNLKLAGTLDDIGVITKNINNRNRNQLVLMDIKTSNQVKNHYYHQVALYYYMFYKLTRLRPKEAFIVRLSKEDGSYDLEYLQDIPLLIKESKFLMGIDESLTRLKAQRKTETIKIA